MHGPARIVRATPATRDAVLALWSDLVEHHRALDAAYPVPKQLAPALARELDRGLSDASCAIWLAEREEPLGFLFAEVETPPDPDAGHDGLAWVHELYVVPAARRSGVARALVAEALAFFEVRGVGRASVRVETKNDVGREFWSAHGFVEKARILERRRS